MNTAEDADSHSEYNRMNALIPYGIESKLSQLSSNSFHFTSKNQVLILDGIIISKVPYLSLSKQQIKSALEENKIQKIIEKIYINQFGVPAIIHRIIGENVYNFANLIGLSPLSPEQIKEFERILNSCAFTYAGENLIYTDDENKLK